MDNNGFIKNTLDEIPEANSDAKRITGLVKKRGKITGYRLSEWQ